MRTDINENGRIRRLLFSARPELVEGFLKIKNASTLRQAQGQHERIGNSDGYQ
jgi:hypothetical protein